MWKTHIHTYTEVKMQVSCESPSEHFEGSRLVFLRILSAGMCTYNIVWPLTFVAYLRASTSRVSPPTAWSSMSGTSEDRGRSGPSGKSTLKTQTCWWVTFDLDRNHYIFHMQHIQDLETLSLMSLFRNIQDDRCLILVFALKLPSDSRKNKTFKYKKSHTQSALICCLHLGQEKRYRKTIK